MSNKNKKLDSYTRTPKDIDEKLFVKLWNDSTLSKKDIEERLGLTRHHSGQIEKRLGLQRRDQVTHITGMNAEEIAWRIQLVKAESLRKKAEVDAGNWQEPTPKIFCKDHSRGSVVFRQV